jgi:NADPH:quinone reductase-like Zn-dependent oxidoreductase
VESADHFFSDVGQIADKVRRTWNGGADKILDLVGTTTLADSLASVRERTHRFSRPPLATRLTLALNTEPYGSVFDDPT